jgi:hypothetical protein
MKHQAESYPTELNVSSKNSIKGDVDENDNLSEPSGIELEGEGVGGRQFEENRGKRDLNERVKLL